MMIILRNKLKDMINEYLDKRSDYIKEKREYFNSKALERFMFRFKCTYSWIYLTLSGKKPQ